MDVKAEIKTAKQRCEKSFEEHAWWIDLHNTALKNIETQMGQLLQAVQGKNSVVLQGEKGLI